MVIHARISEHKYSLRQQSPRLRTSARPSFPHEALPASALAGETAPEAGVAEPLASALVNGNLSALDPQELQQRILADSHLQGLRQGYVEGQQRAQEELADVVHAFQQATAELRRQADEFFNKTEATLPILALDIARQVIRAEVSTNDGVVKAAVREALTQMKDADLTLKLNPQDASLVRHHLPELAQAAEHGTFVRIVEDPRIERGGCVVESPQGAIDAQPGSKLQQIERSYRDGM